MVGLLRVQASGRALCLHLHPKASTSAAPGKLPSPPRPFCCSKADERFWATSSHCDGSRSRRCYPALGPCSFLPTRFHHSLPPCDIHQRASCTGGVLSSSKSRLYLQPPDYTNPLTFLVLTSKAPFYLLLSLFLKGNPHVCS